MELDTIEDAWVLSNHQGNKHCLVLRHEDGEEVYWIDERSMARLCRRLEQTLGLPPRQGPPETGE